MTSEQTYPPRIVCAALNIPHGTLATWAKRGLLANFDAAFPGRGKARPFTMKDVLALALIKTASDHQLQPMELSGFAPAAARQFLHHPDRIRELVIRYYGSGDKVAIRYNDDVMAEPPEAGAIATVSFNLAMIFETAAKAIRAVVDSKPYVVKGAARIEEVDPLLDEISRVRLP